MLTTPATTTPVTTTGGGTTTPPRYPVPPPFGGRGFFGNPGSYPGSPRGWATAGLPPNAGQQLPKPFVPNAPIKKSGTPTVTVPKSTPTTPGDHETTKPSAPKATSSKTHGTTKSTESKTRTTVKEKAVDTVIHSLSHGRG